MIRRVLLALILTTPAHAERWCNGTLTSNNVCESKRAANDRPLRLLR